MPQSPNLLFPEIASGSPDILPDPDFKGLFASKLLFRTKEFMEGDLHHLAVRLPRKIQEVELKHRTRGLRLGIGRALAEIRNAGKPIFRATRNAQRAKNFL